VLRARGNGYADGPAVGSRAGNRGRPHAGHRAPGARRGRVPAGLRILEDVIGNGPAGPGPSSPRSSSSCPAAIRCCAAAFSASSAASSCADPRCSIWCAPRREDQTTCTAVAPDVVFMVRTYGTRPLYGPRLVRKFSSSEPKTRRSATRDIRHSQNVAQARSESYHASETAALLIRTAGHGQLAQIYSLRRQRRRLHRSRLKQRHNGAWYKRPRGHGIDRAAPRLEVARFVAKVASKDSDAAK
jgi:hypothetical protein